jgi:type I restriction enzyme M protein
MFKTRDFPCEVKGLYKIFEKFIYRHEPVRVFEDFLDLVIKQFSFDDASSLNADIQKRYSQEERYWFGDLIRELINIMNKQLVEDDDWFDAIGIFYEGIASEHKKSGFGQFFTPSTIVNFMVELQVSSNNIKGMGLKVNDCACGSGRLLIAFHAKYPGNYMFGQDLDNICAKMSVVNMLLHGAQGEIVHADTIFPDRFYKAWRITKYINGMPMCYRIEKAESFVYGMLKTLKENKSEQQPQIVIDNKVGMQLSLF